MRHVGYPIVVTSLLLVAGSAASQGTTGDETAKAVWKAWSDRHQRVKSARLSWLERETHVKGSQDPTGAEQGRSVPPEDVTFDSPKTFTFDGTKYRLDSRSSLWSQEEGKFKPDPYLATFDGKTAMNLHTAGLKHYPQGAYLKEQRHPDIMTYQLMVPITHFRAADSKANFIDPRKYSDTGQIGVIDGRTCLILKGPSFTAGDSATLWIDRERDHALTRALATFQGKPTVSVNVRHRQDAGEWVPSEWTIVENMAPSGALIRSYVSTLKGCELNVAVSPDEFRIEFPVGTVVYDARTRPTKQWLVKEGDVKRDIPPSDRQATYEQVVASEPGMALATELPSRPLWSRLLPAAGVLLAVAMAFVVVRRVRARRNPAI